MLAKTTEAPSVRARTSSYLVCCTKRLQRKAAGCVTRGAGFRLIVVLLTSAIALSAASCSRAGIPFASVSLTQPPASDNQVITAIIGATEPHPTAVARDTDGDGSLQLGTVPPPPGLGCYALENRSWEAKPCFSASNSSEVPTEGGAVGVQGLNAGSNEGESLVGTEVKVSFSQFSGESDSKFGSNEWSIQANTNDFVGSNGADDWVQFVEQNAASTARMCVWSWDLSTNSSTSSCVSTLHQGFSTSANGFTVEGYITSTGALGGLYIGPGGGEWSVATTDLYDLAPNWSSASGTVLGLSSGSEAVFSAPVSESTLLLGYYVYTPSSVSWPVEVVTAETNSLDEGTPVTSCSYTSGDPGYVCSATTPSSE